MSQPAGVGCRAASTGPREATALRMTLTRSVARPTTPSRHSAGRGRVPRRAYAESGGGPDGPLSARDGDQSRPGRRADSRATGHERPRDGGAGRGGERPIQQICARSDVMSPLQSKLRAVLAGLAVVVVVGFVDPDRAGDRHGFSLVAQWGIRRERSDPSRTLPSRRRGVDGLAAHHRRPVSRRGLGAPPPRQPPAGRRSEGHLAGWVLGFALLVLPGSAMGAGLAGATTATAPISAPLPATDEVASPPSLSAPISPVSSAPSADSPVVSATPVSTNTVSTNTVATYTVVSGDCLSTIALRFYGDEGAWNEIWAANANRMMADGMRFVDPNLIYVGWILVLPGLPGASPTESTPTDPTPSLSMHPPASKLVPAPSADSPRADGQRGRSGLGESGPGQTKAASAPTTNPVVGTAPTRAGRCRRARRGWDTSWREQRR